MTCGPTVNFAAPTSSALESAGTVSVTLNISPAATAAGDGSATAIAWEVVSRRPHDARAFTQGLQLDAAGRLFESTSELRQRAEAEAQRAEAEAQRAEGEADGPGVGTREEAEEDTQPAADGRLVF